jgi:hypothetical protein
VKNRSINNLPTQATANWSFPTLRSSEFLNIGEGKTEAKYEKIQKQITKTVKEIPKSNVNLLKRSEFLNINRFGGGSVESKDESIRTKCKEINPEEKEAILYSINTFIYLGKIQNYSILNLKDIQF